MVKNPAGSRWPRIARRNFLHLAGAAALGLPSGVRAENASANATAPNTTAPNASVPNLWTSAFDEKIVWGYADRHSIHCGEPFNLMLSTGPSRETVKGRVEFFRIGPVPPGQPRHRPAFASFRDRKLVFQGLRKSAVVMLLETDAEVAAITGQPRDMVAHYS